MNQIRHLADIVPGAVIVIHAQWLRTAAHQLAAQIDGMHRMNEAELLAAEEELRALPLAMLEQADTLNPGGAPGLPEGIR